ncbi:MAG: hypothetical protein N3E42_05225 [Candidatus Bipolaricaulota bacterium]|nr:hypothetical protein [Candidatus Bipolaricaulota bacterium]
MPEPAYISERPLAEHESTVLVICCSSHVFLPYTQEFLEKHVGLEPGRYDLLAVPGGPQFLLLTEYLPKFAWAGQRWVKFLVERHRLKRVIAISHEDCAWYSDDRFIPQVLQRFGVGRSLKDRQREDLREIVQALRNLGLPISVEAYYAEKSPDEKVRFVREA